jgi:hypothetical protein
LNVRYGGGGWICAVELGLGLENPVHRRVGHSAGGGSDDVAVDEPAEVRLPLTRGCVLVGELGTRAVGILITTGRSVLAVHEGADASYKIAFGEVRSLRLEATRRTSARETRRACSRQWHRLGTVPRNGRKAGWGDRRWGR